MQNIIITGGTGMVGTALTKLLLSKGYGVHILTRNATKYTNTETVKYYNWDTNKQTVDANAFTNAIGVVNLAGAGVADKRWSVSRKAEILESRTNAGATITNALQTIPNQIKVLVQASATGWYGQSAEGSTPFTESATAATDYLGNTCKAWEQSIAAVKNMAIKVVTLRIGIVLSTMGGMVKQLLLPMQLGVLPVFGNGKQIISWVHINDLCQLILYSIETNMEGTYNAVATEPLAQKVFVKRLATFLQKKWWIAFPIPAFILKIMLGEMSEEVLKSCALSNQKLLSTGFQFEYPNL